MKLLLMADGVVGANFARFVMNQYPDDLVLLVTTRVNELYREAERRGFVVCIFESEKNVLDKLNTSVDLGILAWWPKILKSPLLNSPRLGFLNTHPSFLPHNRGKHYNFWALVERAPFGVTLHKVDSGVDSGAIVAQTTIDYDWCDTGGTLYDKAQVAMLKLLVERYPCLRRGVFASVKQNLETGTFHYASELEGASKIDLEKNYLARDLLNLLRARTFEGYPGCWFEEAGSRYEISVNIKRVGE